MKVKMHEEICKELNGLYAMKNADYNDSFATGRKVVHNYTNGKLYDKVNRFINLTQNGDQQVRDETIEDTLMDLANYAIMEIVERRIDHEITMGVRLEGAPEDNYRALLLQEEDDVCNACGGSGIRKTIDRDGIETGTICKLCDGSGVR